jgi:hypothetical protein
MNTPLDFFCSNLLFDIYHNTYSLPLFIIIIGDTFLRMLTTDEKNILHLTLEDKETGYRAKIILLKNECYTIPEIRKKIKIINM